MAWTWWLLIFATACRLGFDSDDDDDPVSDAPPANLDAGYSMPPGDAGSCEPIACTDAGGSCVAGVCELVASAETVLRCPDGMPCRLVCAGYRYCRDGASCAGATWCEVACVGYRACQDGVNCGTAQCAVTCDGEEACEAGITLGPGGSCESHCCGVATCGTPNPCSTDEICS